MGEVTSKTMDNTLASYSDFEDEFDHGIVVLSYEGIRVMYADVANGFSKFAISLDLTENELTDLSFLRTFYKLETLVLDKNRMMNPETMPMLKSLEILWLNNCNIPDISPWIEAIRVRCPKLRCLSLINNPGAKSLINHATPEDNEHYRNYVASKLKSLRYLDEAPLIHDPVQNSSSQFLSKLFNYNRPPSNSHIEHKGKKTWW